jgi:hypothetical protein
MPSPDFRDRALTAIQEGGLKVFPWTKVLNNTLAGSVSCLYQAAGMPEAGTYPGNVREANMIYPGMVPNILGPASRIVPPLYRNHLIQAEALSPVANMDGILMVGDLLTTYRGLPADTGAAQDLSTLGSAAGRSILPRYADGRGVRIFADVTTAFGATPVTLTISYTNELGTSAKSSVSTTVASVPAGRSACLNPRDAFSLPLASGDKGVRSLQTATLSATTGAAGVYTLFLYRPLMTFYVNQHGTGTSANYGVINNNGEVQPPELLSGAVLVLFWIPLTAVNDALYGHIKTLKVNKGR